MSGLFLSALDSAAAPAALGTSYYFIVLAVMIAIMYFITIRPQRKQEKEKSAMMNTLAVGDSVRTTGGFIGTLVAIYDDKVIVEFGSNKNCRIPMYKEAIVAVEKPEDAVKAESAKKEKK
ncbi:preprotein translocase subunit YajC [Butyrivibrio sp. NC3005]|uniref:preprotein translocase subunit YajC n=1 Tax=Butyrivibrio sp. NC3005 TaxID=1280685 RepID=UPI0003FBA379|nr:preprotein translocase subunit YajC [Butyrivibrio sp. NC3005]